MSAGVKLFLFISKSLSCKPKDINNYVVVLEWVLFAKVSIILGVPEAASAHVESAISFLQNDHVCGKLEIFINLLEELDNNLACIVAPFLSFLRIIDLLFKGIEN